MAKANIFNTIQVAKPQTSTFDLTHDIKFSSRMGELTPILATEVLPGDKFNIGADALIRFAPLVAPVMHRMDATIHYFFVPNRILWSDWEDFITNNATVVHPYITLEDTAGSLTPAQLRMLDYMGIPPTDGTGQPLQVNALPFAAYQAIYNEWYRDQNLVTEVDYKLTSGEQSVPKFNTLLTQRLRAYQHDYFTAALPFAQKGADVEIPLGDVTIKDDLTGLGGRFRDQTGTVATENPLSVETGGAIWAGGEAGDGPLSYDPMGTLETGSTTINNLRRAFKLQEWLEKQARGGTRYIEQIWSHFFVKSSDKRMQRPEYITGIKQPVVVSEVLNTSGQVIPDGETGTPLPQGNMSGHGVSVVQGHAGSYYAEEHGWIIGIMSVMPLPAYMDGMHKQFRRSSPLDYAWPSFAHIGEQEVTMSELYVNATDPDEVFGYVPRYAEYKYIPSRVAGEFRTTLDYWHLGRKFSAEPTLSQEFIECDPDDQTRIFAVEDGTDELYCHVLHKIRAQRRLPYFGNPML